MTVSFLFWSGSRMDEFVHEFVHLITDPVHTSVELFFVTVDYLIIHAVVRRWRKHFHKDIGIKDNHEVLT